MESSPFSRKPMLKNQPGRHTIFIVRTGMLSSFAARVDLVALRPASAARNNIFSDRPLSFLPPLIIKHEKTHPNCSLFWLILHSADPFHLHQFEREPLLSEKSPCGSGA